MGDGSKAGLAGVVLLAGAGLARSGDDCARGGVRGASVLDDAAGGAAGARMASWGPEKATRIGADDAVRMGLTPDDAARLGVRVDGAAVPRVHGAALGEARAGEGAWFETVRDLELDLWVDVVTADFDGELPEVITTPGEVRCPRRLDVTRTPDEWDRLLDGFGVACAPVVVVGTASPDGRALRVGGGDVPLLELARACADAGARCVLVGCPAARADACAEATEASFADNRLQPSYLAYVRGLVELALTQAVAPVVVAQLVVMDGDAKLVSARPGPVGQ
jgi:hypothetical protein